MTEISLTIDFYLNTHSNQKVLVQGIKINGEMRDSEICWLNWT